MTDPSIQLWNSLLERVKADVNEQIFNAWFIPMTPFSLFEDKLVLAVPNDFFKEWVLERYSKLIKSHLQKITSKNIDIEFVVSTNQETQPLSQAAKQTAAPSGAKEKKSWFRSVFSKPSEEQLRQETGINPKYSFDNFVVGASNRFAYAAAMAIVESPARAYNPLFIYGGVGMGKTHLMHSIGNELIKKSITTKILYISSEEFTNQLITAIQKRTTQNFRQRYRHVDVLLIDDIHFIAGKESTQEEFFHTFNSLYDAHKQIIISSDRSPKEIPTLEDRLVSRFEWGLITDIQLPDFETRIAILRKKSEQETIYLPDDLFFFLAEKIKTNIRELEGALIRVVAYSKLMNRAVSVELAQEVLRGMIIEGEKKIGVPLIQNKVAEYFDISPHDMKAKKRTKAIAYPRQIAMYLSRDMTDLSLPEIGHFFGGRDHTTVLHACEKIEKSIKSDDKAKWLVHKLRGNIKQNG